jgi:Fe-Mn family superoxide dismutase
MRMLTASFAVATAALFALPASAQPQTAPFTLPELPYATDALEPMISAETMALHHGKHHQSYVDNLNKALEAGDESAESSLAEIVAAAGEHSTAIRNNAGGHWNHSFFWETMAPADEAGEASAELTAAIEGVYGSMDGFKTAFEEAGVGRFGSGWVWLIVNEAGELEITSTPNQDNPLMDVAEVQGTPLLGNDVWEHAYYLTYNNRRAEYLTKWWDVVDWTEVSERYAEALAD